MSIAPVSFKAYQTDFEGFARDLGVSFERYGFAVISDHDLDQGLIDRATAASKAFFALPEAEKLTYKIAGAGGQRGYTPFGVETAKGAEHFDLKEFWHTGRALPPGHPYRASMPDNVWPKTPAGFHEAVGGLYDALDHLGNRILRAIARHLHLGGRLFRAHRPSRQQRAAALALSAGAPSTGRTCAPAPMRTSTPSPCSSARRRRGCRSRRRPAAGWT